MNSNKIYKLFVSFFFGILIQIGCNKDTEPKITTVDLGQFYLLEESIELLPYLDKNQIVYVDSFQNEAVFEITELELKTLSNRTLSTRLIVDENCTIEYSYGNQIKSFALKNDSLNIRFSIFLEAKPYAIDPQNNGIADVLTIALGEPSSLIGGIIFSYILNQRTYPSSSDIDIIPEQEILGETFFDVLNNDYLSSKTKVNFNIDFGLISFTDTASQIWRLKEIN